ncbi:four helix bundle protein [Sorangium cellulosum]|nr:four helix bundle protein [Sorangium cellulosum]
MHITVVDPTFGTGWDDWNQENELQRRSANDQPWSCACAKARTSRDLPVAVTGMSNTDRPLLDHENLDAYRVAIEFLALSVQLLEEIPKERRELRLQLERAAMSLPLNIAEGAGKPSPADRARYHGIARGSAMECATLLDVSRIMGVVQSKDVEQGKRLLSRLAAMLTRMCR